MQKIRKILRADSAKKMLLTNGLTNNTEFIGPFSSGVQFKIILHQLLRFVYFSIFIDVLWVPVDGCSIRSCRISFTAYFLTVKDKILEHTLEHKYHRQIFRQIFSTFLLTSPRGVFWHLPNLIEAQQLRLLASISVDVSAFWTYGRGNSLYHSRWGQTLLAMWLQLHYQCDHESILDTFTNSFCLVCKNQSWSGRQDVNTCTISIKISDIRSKHHCSFILQSAMVHNASVQFYVITWRWILDSS